MTKRDDTSPLVKDLWDLVEGWSTAAISLARSRSLPDAPELVEAEIRLHMEHASELRAVIDAHLDQPEVEPEPDPVVVTVAEPVDDHGSAAPIADHRCDSADFERPSCSACGRHHWYCSVCGLQQDACAAA